MELRYKFNYDRYWINREIIPHYLFSSLVSPTGYYFDIPHGITYFFKKYPYFKSTKNEPVGIKIER